MSDIRYVKTTEGDWVCSDPKCGNINFSRRLKCNRCKRDKNEGLIELKKQGTEIGKQMAEKSHGLFSADDWQCKACGNVNWARRSTCNVCNAPKFSKAEKRTGFGGGYMERDEVVEYVERKESDDEFDEFGRKKKKFRGNLPTGSILQDSDSKSSKGEVTSVEKTKITPATANDDEEDEGDDEDISKYKLSDDEDDEDEGDVSKYQLDGDDKNDDASSSSSSSSQSSSSSASSRSSSSSSSSSASSKSDAKKKSSLAASKKSKSSERDEKRKKYRLRLCVDTTALRSWIVH